MRMRIALLVAGVLAAQGVCAQIVNTHSPYSRYGLGLQEHQAYGGTMGFGGVALGVAQKNAINPANPASYGEQDTMTFLFDFGVQGGYSRYRTPGGGVKNAGQANIQHLAFQFPLAKWGGMAIGFQPYSKLGYDVTRYETDLKTISDVGRVRYHHAGHGGINEAFVGVGFDPVPYFSVGVNVHYRFGSINHSQNLYVPSNATYSEYTSESRNVVKAFMLRGGVQARVPLDSTWSKRLVLGVTVDYYPYVYAEERLEATTTYMNTSMPIAQNALRDQKRIQLPMRYGAGLAYESSRWLMGCDFIYEPWGNFSLFGSEQMLTPTMEGRLGVQFTPDVKSLRRYYERMNYRLGFMYSQLPMRIEGRRVDDMSITFGFGFPLGWRKWLMNVAVEIGQRGGFGKDIVNETYCNLHLGVSFIDVWFFKRKYD